MGERCRRSHRDAGFPTLRLSEIQDFRLAPAERTAATRGKPGPPRARGRGVLNFRQVTGEKVREGWGGQGWRQGGWGEG